MESAAGHFVSMLCEDQVCRRCQLPATHRVMEVHALHERRTSARIHAYLCCLHFIDVFGPDAPCSRLGSDALNAKTRRLL